MANLRMHPRSQDQRALGELLPGWFDVPQNPVTMAQDGITYKPGVGEIMQGRYVVPQNPVLDFSRGQVKMLGTSGGNCDPGLGCACDGSINGMSLGDIQGDFTTIQDSIANGNWAAVLTDTIMGIPVWTFAAAAVAWSMLGGKKGRR